MTGLAVALAGNVVRIAAMAMFHWEAHARRSGARFENVRCERCKGFYHYPIVREGRGRSAAMGEEAATRGAQNVAQMRAMRELERGVEIVPCPNCGWVQRDMVREMRRRTGRPLRAIGIVLAALAAIVVLGWAGQKMFTVEDGRGDVWPLNPLWPLGLVTAALVIFAVRLMMQMRVDPNRVDSAPRARVIAGGVEGIPGKASAEMLERH